MTSPHVPAWRVFLAAFGLLCACLVAEAFFACIAAWGLAELGLDGPLLVVLSAVFGLAVTAAVITVACE